MKIKPFYCLLYSPSIYNAFNWRHTCPIPFKFWIFDEYKFSIIKSTWIYFIKYFFNNDFESDIWTHGISYWDYSRLVNIFKHFWRGKYFSLYIERGGVAMSKLSFSTSLHFASCIRKRMHCTYLSMHSFQNL